VTVTHTSKPTWSIRKSDLSFENIVLFLLPLSMIFSINVMGQILMSDFLVIYTFFALTNRRKMSFKIPYLRAILALLALWFAAAILSDLMNGSSVKNLMRGWAKLVLFGFYITVILNLVRGSRKRAALAMVGLGISLILKTDISADFGNESAFRTTWKFGMGLGVVIVLHTALKHFGMKPRAISLLLLMLSPMHLFLGARSQFLILALSSGISMFRIPVKSANSRLYLSLIFFLFLGAGIGAGQTIYDSIVKSGVFGQEALEKHLSQTANGESVLFGARAESLVSTIAIADKPLLGHGSWAENRDYVLLYLKLKEQNGNEVRWDSDFAQQSLIPSHSMLLGAAVEHGAAGAIFWLYILSIALRALVAGALGRQSASTIEMLAVLNLIWDIFFSPFGATRRCYEVIFLAISIALIQANDPLKINQERGQE